MQEKEHVVVAVGFHKKEEPFHKKLVNIVKKLDAEVTLVHAIEYIPNYSYFPYDEKKVEESLKAEVDEKFANLKKLFEDSGVKVANMILKRDKAYKAICDVADEVKATKIMIGVGPHYILETMIGSTADKVLRMAHQDVFLINPYKDLTGFDKVLCGFDFTKNSDLAAVSATKLATKFSSKEYLLHIVPDNLSALGSLDDISSKVTSKIEAKLEALEVPTSNAEIHVAEGTTVLAISKFIEDKDIDLLVIGESSHNSFTRFFLGSTTEKLVRKAPCNVLVVKNH